MMWASVLSNRLETHGLGAWSAPLLGAVDGRFSVDRNRDVARWMAVVDALEPFGGGVAAMTDGLLDLGPVCDDALTGHLEKLLLGLLPWRKGPVRLGGVMVETEWRSDWKWDRVVPHVAPLTGRRVLDVGCGNGYYGYRARLAGAGFYLGVDPYLLSVAQFLAMHALAPLDDLFVLPLGVDDLPEKGAFDTVFSMGLLYHRRDPLVHLKQMGGFLRPGGEFVLETLVSPGTRGDWLSPKGRYARMRNVWQVPSLGTVEMWLEQAGFEDVRLLDQTVTTSDEQRRTRFMPYESLSDFLDPADRSRTVEGYPAPVRAAFGANIP